MKPDNLLLRSAGRGLRLIDFGQAVDLTMLPAGYALRGDSGLRHYRCLQMVGGDPWVYEADNYGIACCVHLLLHFKPMG
eukprot:SAG11_NODE_2675_length_3106_cov_2.195211_3_plen_79_part_00